jgi:DNA polymerase III subunit epsilon
MDSLLAASRYRSRFGTRPPFDLVWEHLRFVAIDTETTGLDVQRDRLVSIGAVALEDHQIDVGDTLEVLLPVSHNTATVTLHGVTREAARRDGIPEAVAIAGLLDYLGDAIVVGHHVGHDIAMLNAACARHCDGLVLQNDAVDTRDLALRLAAAGFLPEAGDQPSHTLDDLCRIFAITPHDRHTASGDAFLTAQIFLRLLRRAQRAGWLTIGALSAPAPAHSAGS